MENKCPFLNKNKVCSHKNSRWTNEYRKNGLSKCMYCDANKCRLYDEWYNQISEREKKELKEFESVFKFKEKQNDSVTKENKTL